MGRLTQLVAIALLCLGLGPTSARAVRTPPEDIPRAELVLVQECPGVTAQADLQRVESYVDGELVPALDVEPDGRPAVHVIWTRGRVGDLPSGIDRLPGVCGVWRNRVWSIEQAVPLPPRDPYWRTQWGMQAIGVEGAWEITGGGHSIVAVVDTGVDCGHPDLEFNCVRTHFDTLSRDELDASQTTDQNGHGTHVAGIVAAQRDERGVAGVAPWAQVVSVRVCSRGGQCSELDILAGLVWLSGRADIVNMSLGGFVSPLASRICDELAGMREDFGVLAVAAVGNNGLKGSRLTEQYPATCSAVVGVASGDPPTGLRLSDYSTRASAMITGPGAEIMSTLPTGYGILSGTSMASPHVAGVAALVHSAMIDAGQVPTPRDIEQILLETARRFCGEPTPQNQYLSRLCGYGLVQADLAVRAVLPVAPDTPTPSAGPVDPTQEPTPTPPKGPTHIPPVQTALAQTAVAATLTAVAATPTMSPTLTITPTPIPDWTHTPTPSPTVDDPVAATLTAEAPPVRTATAAAEATTVAATLTALAPTPNLATQVSARKTEITNATETAVASEASATARALRRQTLYIPLVNNPALCRFAGSPFACGWATEDAASTSTAVARETIAAPTPQPTPTRCFPCLRQPSAGRLPVAR